MGKKIKFYNNYKNKIILNNRMFYYQQASGRIQQNFEIERLLKDNDYLKETIKLGFDYYEKTFVYDNRQERFYIPVSRNFIKYYNNNWLGEGTNKKDILLSNTHLNNNVDAFYEFSLEVIIDNFRTIFQRSIAYEDMIYIESPTDENKKMQMTKLFGKPENIPEMENEKYGSGKKYFYYIVPKAKIDKIIGIKRYRDTATFGQEDGEQYTGEKEESVLDLHNFDVR